MDILNTKIKDILEEKKTKIKSQNIKSGINILGVQGSSKVLDTTDSNAIANDIVTGKTAFVNGQKITGTYTGIIPTGTKNIIENGTVDVTNYASASVNVPTPLPNLQSKSLTITENGTQTISADSGYDGLDEVEITTNVSSSGGGKNFQSNYNLYQKMNSTYSKTSLKLTVNKTGTYTVRWVAYRSSTSYDDFGTALYINDTIYGSRKTTWSTPYIRENSVEYTSTSFQINEVNNVLLSENDVIEIYGKNHSSYNIFLTALTIEEE